MVKHSCPKGVIAVAEVRISSAEEHVGHGTESVVPERPETRDVLAAATRSETGTLRHVCAREQRFREAWNLSGIC